MTREQQRKLRELKQCLPKIIQKRIKPYGFKKKDYIIWSKKNDMFFSLLIDLRERDGHCYCFSWELMKPLWIDDLFWDMMDMSENKSEPLSLRSVGAFAVHGMKNYEDERELSEWSADELEKCVEAYIKHFDDTIKESNLESYYSIFDASAYHGETQEILILVYKQEYQKALERIRAMEDGGAFANKGIWFREYAEAYCKKCMLEQ